MLDSRMKVVIVGGGFGGLTAAKALASNEVDVMLIDSTNHHLFQPLLYQVATTALSAGDIASPLRTIVQGKRNIRVVMDEAIGVDRQARTVQVRDGQLPFDVLILAPGSRHSYVGHDQWEKMAPGLKTLADALSIREHVLLSFGRAAAARSTAEVQRYLRFAIVAGGPTGVELAGGLAEIAKHSIMPEFPTLTPSDIRVILIEAGDRILAGFDEGLSSKAQAVLASLGVEVRLKTRVTDISEQGVYADDTLIETAMSSGPQATKRRLCWPRSARRLIINGAYASSRTCLSLAIHSFLSSAMPLVRWMTRAMRFRHWRRSVRRTRWRKSARFAPSAS